jgi:hypothetical protein
MRLTQHTAAAQENCATAKALLTSISIVAHLRSLKRFTSQAAPALAPHGSRNATATTALNIR